VLQVICVDTLSFPLAAEQTSHTVVKQSRVEADLPGSSITHQAHHSSTIAHDILGCHYCSRTSSMLSHTEV
jgi:hypothetical protein